MNTRDPDERLHDARMEVQEMRERESTEALKTPEEVASAKYLVMSHPIAVAVGVEQMNGRVKDEIALTIQRAVAEFARDACRAVCPECRNEGSGHAYLTDTGYWVHPCTGYVADCLAQNIRALAKERGIE